jgi:hypothetical protein
MIGEIKNTTPLSHYQPSKDVQDLTTFVRKDFASGNEILHRNWVELNNRSVVDDQDRGKRTFNAFVDEEIEDPSIAWQWRGTRSKARNQAIALHAQLTAGYIVPMYMAQNDNDEEDLDFSEVMRDTVEWMVNNSDYKSSFLQAAMGMLVNPVTYLGAEYCEVFQKIKEKTDQGYVVSEVLDEVLSGFQAPIYDASQVLISNVYEQNIQKHRFIIKRRYIEYGEAEAKYGRHENWMYVQPGVKTLYSEDDGLYYDLKDDDHPFLVEEAIYLNRRDDTEVAFVNGIYFGNNEDVEGNPVRHRDNRNAPKYNVTPFGYQRVNEHFFYYKSLMNVQYWDNQLLDAQYQIGMNRAFLDANMPVAISGADKIDSDVIFPSSVVSFEDPNTKIAPLLPQANLGGIFTAMDKVEGSMEESSISSVSAGQLPQASQKATSVAIANRNAQTLLAGVGKNLAQSVVQYGDLMKDIAIQHIVVPQIEEILDDNVNLKYKKLTLQDKMVNGREVSKEIRFEESFLGAEMSEKDKRDLSLKLLKDSGYPKVKKHIYMVNPELFSRFRYLTRVEPEKMFPENEEFMQAMMSQIYAQMADNPFIELEALTRKTLYTYFRSDTEDLMKKTGEMQPQQMTEQPAPTQFGQQAQNQATASTIPQTGRV